MGKKLEPIARELLISPRARQLIPLQISFKKNLKQVVIHQAIR
jgi:hypothetical protein